MQAEHLAIRMRRAARLLFIGLARLSAFFICT